MTWDCTKIAWIDHFRKFTKEKEEALAQQWEEAERLKTIAVQEACEKLQHKVRGQFIIEREKAVAEALTRARVSR